MITPDSIISRNKSFPFAGTLTYAGKNRDAFVSLRDVIDQFHDQNCLAYTSTSEQPNLTTLSVRLNQVDDLNPGEQDFGGCIKSSNLGASW